MKKCPACEAVFNDDSMGFCPNCGTELVNEIAPETVAEPVVEPIVEPAPQPIPPVQPQYNYNYNYNNQYNAPPCKYCSTCGNPCDPRAAICVKCGTPFGKAYSPYSQEYDKPSGGLKFLCLLIPVVGLVLYLVYMNEKPVSAKAYGKMALIGFIIGIVLYILYFVFIFLLYFFGFAIDSSINYYDSYMMLSLF